MKCLGFFVVAAAIVLASCATTQGTKEAAKPAEPAKPEAAKSETSAQEQADPADLPDLAVWTASEFAGAGGKVAPETPMGIATLTGDSTGNGIVWKASGTTISRVKFTHCISLPWDTKPEGDCLVLKVPAGAKQMLLYVKNGSSSKDALVSVAIPSLSFAQQTEKVSAGSPKRYVIDLPEIAAETELQLGVGGASDDSCGTICLYQVNFK